MERIVRSPWEDFNDFYEKTLREEVEFYSNDNNTFQFRGILKAKDPAMTVKACAENLKNLGLIKPGDGLFFPKDNIFLMRSFTGEFWIPLKRGQLTNSIMLTPEQEQQKIEQEKQEKMACILDLLALS